MMFNYVAKEVLYIVVFSTGGHIFNHFDKIRFNNLRVSINRSFLNHTSQNVW